MELPNKAKYDEKKALKDQEKEVQDWIIDAEENGGRKVIKHLEPVNKINIGEEEITYQGISFLIDFKKEIKKLWLITLS